MVRAIAVIVALAAAANVQASSVSEYYYKGCGLPENTEKTGGTPVYCNTQQGASIGYTLDAPCSFYIYSGQQCAGNPVRSYAAATKNCIDFPSTKGSWIFKC
jgi:hypothetical protein